MAKKDLELYSHMQLVEMIAVTRSWTLHNPSGPLPPLPLPLYTYNRESKRMELEKDAEKTLPIRLRTHWLVKLLWRFT